MPPLPPQPKCCPPTPDFVWNVPHRPRTFSSTAFVSLVEEVLNGLVRDFAANKNMLGGGGVDGGKPSI
jgi:hypothetical protein